MWELFTSVDVEAVEQNIIDSFNKLVSQVVEKKMLGNRDLVAEKKALGGLQK